MKKISTLLVFCFILMSIQKTYAQFPTIYSYKLAAGGSWATAANWETFPGNATNTPAGAMGSGSTTASIPSGTHFVYIRSGQTITMSATSHNVMGMTIETTGVLTTGGPTSRSLRLGNGGTGFTGPNNYSFTNNGTAGLTGDVLVLETVSASGVITLTGNGVYNLSRIRMTGGSPNNIILNIDADLTMAGASNYALSAAYNPQSTDNYTVNLNAGKTVTLSNASGYFNNNSLGSGGGFGTYTYNINGTLDLTASTQTSSNLTAFSPTDGTYNLNIGATGLLKTGAAFNSSPVSPGIANLNIASGGVVDATLATVFNFNGNAFNTASSTAILRRTVTGDGTRSNFPVKTSAGNLTPVTISRLNTSSSSAVYTASVQNTFDNPPVDPNKCVNKQWNLGITGTPSADDTIRLSWLAADNGTNFSPTGTVAMMHYTGGAYEYKPAVVTGTGIVGDPYVARASGFTSYSPFGITSAAVLPLNLLSFTASSFGKSTTLNWVTSNEINVKDFDLQKSDDGISFSAINKTVAQNNVSNRYSYTDGTSSKEIVYYRIKMNDADGRFTYSNILKVKAGQDNAAIKVYPNPVQNTLFVEHNLATKNTVISIFSADGKLVARKSALQGQTKTTVDVSDLRSGNYSIRMVDENGSNTSGFIKL